MMEKGYPGTDSPLILYVLCSSQKRDDRSMGRKQIDQQERKHTITIRLPLWMIKQLREMTNYNAFIEQVLRKYFKKRD